LVTRVEDLEDARVLLAERIGVPVDGGRLDDHAAVRGVELAHEELPPRVQVDRSRMALAQDADAVDGADGAPAAPVDDHARAAAAAQADLPLRPPCPGV